MPDPSTPQAPDKNPQARDDSTHHAGLDFNTLDPAKPAEYLSNLRKFAEDKAHEAIDWYMHRRRKIAFWSKALRMAAIVSASIGAILPLLQATPLLSGWLGGQLQTAAGELGYLFLALGGSFVVADKLFGVSTRWMRFITTAQALEHHLAVFEMDWASVWMELNENTPTDEQRKRLLALVSNFRVAIIDEVRQETSLWVAEFQSSLAQLERQARADASSTSNPPTGNQDTGSKHSSHQKPPPP